MTARAQRAALFLVLVVGGGAVALLLIAVVAFVAAHPTLGWTGAAVRMAPQCRPLS